MTIDCNTLFGYWQKDLQDRSLERLLHILRTNGVDYALTASGRGVWDSFADGNEETLRVCAEHPELLPAMGARGRELAVTLYDARLVAREIVRIMGLARDEDAVRR